MAKTKAELLKEVAAAKKEMQNKKNSEKVRLIAQIKMLEAEIAILLLTEKDAKAKAAKMKEQAALAKERKALEAQVKKEATVKKPAAKKPAAKKAVAKKTTTVKKATPKKAGRLILTINPGSTSTKVAIFRDETLVVDTTLRHSAEEIGKYKDIQDQYKFRDSVIQAFIKEAGFKVTDFDAVVGRGGLFPKKRMASGVYAVTPKMIEDIVKRPIQAHASNLGCRLADAIAKKAKCPSFIVDPVVVDELSDIARVSGHKGYERTSLFHALNSKAIAYRMSKDLKKNYKDINVIVAHLGGGVTVGAHEKGKVVDVNKGLMGQGPMSPERTGTMEIEHIVNITLANKTKTVGEITKMFVGKGGICSYTGLTDMREVNELAKKDKKVKLVVDAFTYQVAKEIGSCAAALSGKVNAIAITGGIAYSKDIVKAISDRVEFIAPVMVYPGEDEMLALAQGAIRVMDKKEIAKKY